MWRNYRLVNNGVKENSVALSISNVLVTHPIAIFACNYIAWEEG